MTEARVAYFSMEIALDAAMPTYSGGLGVLAGDTIRSFADLGVPAVAVTLLHRQGYFRQALNPAGRQSEEPAEWDVSKYLECLENRVHVEIEGRTVAVRAWRYCVRGVAGAEVSTYLLDTDLPENHPADRRLTGALYGGDDRYRLAQEIVLGVAGVRMLRALGNRALDRFHLNEGHAALAVLALLEERLETGPQHGPRVPQERLVEEIRRQCVFTTHTPVPAGHDKFDEGLVRQLLNERQRRLLAAFDGRPILNLTEVALRASHFVNGVAMRHGEVSRSMFPGYPIRSITNGIHPATWAAHSFRTLFDHHIREWRRDSLSLRYAIGIPLQEVEWAHVRAKQALLAHVNRVTGSRMTSDVLTIGFARRATAYKRATLLFEDVERLAALARDVGPIQLVFAGKAHPRDEEGKHAIQRIFAARQQLGAGIQVAYLPDYDMALGKLLCAGCDVWLNTPVSGLEASGTSGMKAALNGVPSLSVLDGWWVEGCVEGVTGWAIGADRRGEALGPGDRDRRDAAALYDKLEGAVLPCFYQEPGRFREMMRSAIALNASFFNTQRMVLQYLYDAYQRRGEDRSGKPR